MNLRASIDIGSNTILLLIGSVEDGLIAPVLERSTVTGLGKGIDDSGKFDPASKSESLNTLKAYSELIQENGIDLGSVVVTATEASRVAKDSADFFKQVESVCGLKVSIIDAEGEAYYTALGVAGEYLIKSDRVVIMDIGGASTELICVEGPELKVTTSISLPMGSVRGTEWMKAGSFDSSVSRILEGIDLGPFITDHLVCVAGSMTSVGGMIKGLKLFDSEKIHGTATSVERFEKFYDGISRLKVPSLLESFPFLGKRAATIRAGAKCGLMLGRVIKVKTFEISTKGLRHGTLLTGEVDPRFLWKDAK